jgi:methylthioribose-1-phosphate isomerase
MKINGQPYRTIWQKPGDSTTIQIIDQRHLPHKFVIEDLRQPEDFEVAIRDMHVRGAPLIGSAAAYGMYIAALLSPAVNFDENMREAARRLLATRPTAVNLAHAIDQYFLKTKDQTGKAEKVEAALQNAHDITEESVEHCRLIGQHGLEIISEIFTKKKAEGSASPVVNILTHCNAGWLACVDFGTATAPVYAAHDAGIPVHVWVDETRPRNQGARLTAFELKEHGVPHTVIVDNVGGHLMQHGMVDLAIVGTDRTTRTGDVANKIGTYLKALAAHDNGVPFYVAAPSSSIDWTLRDGLSEIPIEKRGEEEVKRISGLDENGEVREVILTPAGSPALNYGFDVTPARLVSGLITERGICEASEKGLSELFDQ